MDLLLYSNELDVENFIHMLDDPTECYKFYWMDSVLSLLAEGMEIMTFDEIINGMIADAWYSVTEYHLHLGLKDRQGNSMNSLERAVYKLREVSEIENTACREEIIQEIKANETYIHSEKYQMTKNVPYRVLSSFLWELGGNDRIWDQKKRLIAYIEKVNRKKVLPYSIEDGVGLKKKVVISRQWVKMLQDQMVPIKGWIQLKKVKYLQDRNPGVPGIIYKLEPENENLRKLKNVRELWNTVMDIKPVYDIYSRKKINKNDYEMDHFVPWSYVVNDEMWNLMPMESRLNASKNNKLPDWDHYFKSFAGNQFCLYEMVFGNEQIRKQFDNCQRDNLVSLWASEELYIPGITKAQFENVLEQHLKPIYDAARIQGYKIWENKCTNGTQC